MDATIQIIIIPFTSFKHSLFKIIVQRDNDCLINSNTLLINFNSMIRQKMN
jgi:hypothetical protein